MMKLLSRAEAKRLGLPRYFTGKPCLNGHIAQRLTSTARCYECMKIASRLWKQSNKKYVNEHNKEYIERNPEFAEHLTDYKREWYKRNVERILAKRKIHYENNKSRIKEYLNVNAKRINAQKAAHQHERRELDFIFKLIGNIRNTIKKVFDGRKIEKSRMTFDILGYSPQQLVEHLQEHFLPGMTSANHGSGKGKWNIEHTRPLASFDIADFETPEAMIREAFALSNLRPMWHDDNNKKGSNWNGYRWQGGKAIFRINDHP